MCVLVRVNCVVETNCSEEDALSCGSSGRNETLLDKRLDSSEFVLQWFACGALLEYNPPNILGFRAVSC